MDWLVWAILVLHTEEVVFAPGLWRARRQHGVRASFTQKYLDLTRLGLLTDLTRLGLLTDLTQLGLLTDLTRLGLLNAPD